MNECLMIKVGGDDHIRQFFTHKKNAPLLAEFAKTFNVELCIVKTNSTKLLELKDLVDKFSDPDFTDDSEYEIVERRFPNPSRKETLRRAEKFRNQIRSLFLNGQTVSVKSLNDHAEAISPSTISHHLTTVRKELKDEGYKINEIKRGRYEIS